MFCLPVSQFFSPVLLGTMAFGSVIAQHIMALVHGRGSAHLTAAKRREEEEPGPNIAFKYTL